jgi:hypothetical protein
MSSAGGQVQLYRATHDHSALQQVVIRVATVVEAGGGEGPGEVQVRQLIQCQNGGFEVYDGPSDAPGIGFLFPVPEGASVLELQVGDEAALETAPSAVPHWGYGVPVRQPLFPVENLLLMGKYLQPVVRGELFDIGIEAVVDTQFLRIALEEGKFTHDASVAAEWDVPALAGGELQQMQDVGKTLRNFQSEPLRAHTSIKVPVRFGPPGIKTATIAIALIIAACFTLPVVAGVRYARRRGAGRTSDARAAELRALHTAGELTAEDLDRELVRLGAGGSKVLARLDEIAARAEGNSTTVAADLRDLARIVRDHLREGTR